MDPLSHRWIGADLELWIRAQPGARTTEVTGLHAGALKIRINGQQFVWRFTYPNRAFAYQTMVVPVDTTVTLDIQSQDVAHSWWIPKLGPKFDAIPGYTNHSWFKIPASAIPKGKSGVTFRGQCTELCGYGHANMVAFVRAVPVDRYQQWVARQKREIDQANSAAVQQRSQFNPIPSG